MIINLLAHEVPRKATKKGAELVRDKARELLTTLSHPPETRTPSPLGAPPAAISGFLAGSVKVRSWARFATVRPDAHYGRFLEKGGTHSGHMRWFEDGQRYTADILHKGPRPYMKPARDASVPGVREIFVEEIAKAIRAVLG